MPLDTDVARMCSHFRRAGTLASWGASICLDVAKQIMPVRAIHVIARGRLVKRSIELGADARQSAREN